MKFSINIMVIIMCLYTPFFSFGFVCDNDPHLLLVNSARTGDMRGVQRALAAHASIDFNNGDALFCAASNGFERIVKLLLGRGAKTDNSGGDFALLSATQHGHTRIVKLLLEKEGTHVNAVDSQRYSALMWAEYYKNKDIAKLLRMHGASEPTSSIKNPKVAGRVCAS